MGLRPFSFLLRSDRDQGRAGKGSLWNDGGMVGCDGGRVGQGGRSDSTFWCPIAIIDDDGHKAAGIVIPGEW